MLASTESQSLSLTCLCFKWLDPTFRHYHIYQYSADYVNRLRSMLERHLTIPHRLVCVTDDPIGIDPRVEIVRMPSWVLSLPRYYRKLYAFHSDGAELFGPRVLMIDLDVVIVGDMGPVVERSEPFIAWSTPPNAKARFNTSLVLMDTGKYPEVWDLFDPATSPGELRQAGYEDGDQDWVSWVLLNEGPTWARQDEGIEPYYQIRFGPLPSNASVVFFNGRRSPAMKEVQQLTPWVAEHWK